MRSSLLCVAATLLAAWSPGCSSGDDGATSSSVPGQAAVVRVVDGDTLVVSFDGVEERLRLIGIDTPESVAPERPVECFGEEASAFTASLLPAGTAIRVERDVEARDDYGRLLGYVHRLEDDLFVNLEIVRRGYADPLTIPPNVAHTEEFVEAARAARNDGLGVWVACAG